MSHVYDGFPAFNTIFVSPYNFYNLRFPVRSSNLTHFPIPTGKNNQIEKKSKSVGADIEKNVKKPVK